jgi:hypothetical protein
VGTAEGVRTVANVRLLRELLHAKGFAEPRAGGAGAPHLLRTVVAPGAAHNEAAWGRRLKKAIPWLLGA